MTFRRDIVFLILLVTAAILRAQSPATAPAANDEGLYFQLQYYGIFMEESVADELKKAATAIQSQSTNADAFDIASDDLLKTISQAWGTPALYVDANTRANYANARMIEAMPGQQQYIYINCTGQLQGKNGFWANMSTNPKAKIRFEDDFISVDLVADRVGVSLQPRNGRGRSVRPAEFPSLKLKHNIKPGRAVLFLVKLPQIGNAKPCLAIVLNSILATDRRLHYIEMMYDLSLWMSGGKAGVKKMLDEAAEWEKLVSPPDKKALAAFKKEVFPGFTVEVQTVSIPATHPFQTWDPTGRPKHVEHLYDHLHATLPAAWVTVGNDRSRSATEVIAKPGEDQNMSIEVYVTAGPWTYAADIEENQPVKKGNRSYRMTNVRYENNGDDGQWASCELSMENAGDVENTVAFVDSDGKEYTSMMALGQIQTELPQPTGNRTHWIGQVLIPKGVTIDHFAVKTRAYQKVKFDNVAARPDLSLAAKVGQTR